MSIEHVDVLIVGAGLSGIGAGYHVQKYCRKRSYLILEGRDSMGGTWDLFRYPGIRSDSDMHTLGYRFRPWTNPKAIADGPSILSYINDTAKEFGIDKRIRFGHRVVHSSWSTADSKWTVEATRTDTGETVTLTCNFLFMCSGYYRYEAGYEPEFPGIERFQGRVAHPQKWTPDIEWANKRVVVIGSGATAVTLVPSMAKEAAHVVMLQRSPGYIVSRPAEDATATKLRRWLPAGLAYTLTRWKNVMIGLHFGKLALTKSNEMTQWMIGAVHAAVGDKIDVAKHFTPRYRLGEQRICAVPDGDMFEAFKSGRASIVTDEIETFTEKGIKVRSGEEIEADLVVTATGLVLTAMGNMKITVDGKPIKTNETFGYKGMMYSDIPNLASSFGYTNASWTLKCDLTCEYVCRLLNHMDRKGFRQCVPRNTDPNLMVWPWFASGAGYVQRAREIFPKQGVRPPWILYQNYILDLLALRFGKLNDGVMEFSKP